MPPRVYPFIPPPLLFVPPRPRAASPSLAALSIPPRPPENNIQECSGSASSSNRLLLALCQHACAPRRDTTTTTTTATANDEFPAAATAATATPKGGGESGRKSGGGDENGGGGKGFSPVRLPPASFATVARLLRASLDQAASDREFLQARNCLVTAGLYSVDAAEYVSWLRERGSVTAAAADAVVDGSASNSGSGDLNNKNVSPVVLADSELVSAADMLDGAGRGEEGTEGETGVGADYMLLRELRRHRVWTTIELWEVSISDSVVMAMDGGGRRAQRWLAPDARDALNEVRSDRTQKIPLYAIFCSQEVPSSHSKNVHLSGSLDTRRKGVGNTQVY